MKQVNSGKPPVVGNKTVVLGGGNAAVDAARTAIRLGSKDVRIVCLEERSQMPAFPGEVQGALEEGAVLECGWGPERFLTENGHVSGVELKRCRSVKIVNGRFEAEFDTEQRRILSGNTIIVAVGQSPDLSFLSETGKASLYGARLAANPETMQTGMPGVFAAGDMVNGPTSVVEAMASGNKAACFIDLYVREQDLIRQRILRPALPPEAVPQWSRIAYDPGHHPDEISIDRRRTTFDLIENAFDDVTAKKEANRCIRCAKAIDYYNECWYCLPCEVECPTQALTLEVPFLVR